MERGEVDGIPYILDIEKSLKSAELTQREREILELTHQGYTAEEISKELDILRESISRSISNIADKVRKELKENV